MTLKLTLTSTNGISHFLVDLKSKKEGNTEQGRLSIGDEEGFKIKTKIVLKSAQLSYETN